ncbi:hypothetical protein G7062_08105 [Erysipelothrix sp. HDW6C]|uniref:hypothetical protein n=1 Tax=Erysipelothrix sp. HDW6C TaxID=2714930 RepID=UPI00140E2D71|nr:hypothetical protein [Erysipelothrix sp. HDW6C]QIK70253.1 hypothetical protein G7062_08105 [Erysipelothrix sp. HDW6C]
MKLFSKVRLITNKYDSDGAKKNSIGIVLEVYATGDYEVQFLDKNGEPSDIFFSVHPDEIESFDN